METISGELTSIRLGLERRLFAVNSDEMQHLFKSLELSHPLPKIHHGNIPRAHLGGIDHLQVNNNMLYCCGFVGYDCICFFICRCFFVVTGTR